MSVVHRMKVPVITVSVIIDKRSPVEKVKGIIGEED